MAHSMFGEIQERAAMLAPMPIALVDNRRRQQVEAQRAARRLVDQTLEDSFPASDPPSWTSGVARPASGDAVRNEGTVQRLLRRVAAMF